MAGVWPLALLALSLIGPARAQSDTVWGAVILSTYGDRIPLLSPDSNMLTPLGAQQLYASGQAYRSRYITSSGGSSNSSDSGHAIANISTDRLDVQQTLALGTQDAHVSQSLQAFMSGLYPPTSDGTSQTLANGSSIAAPLDGAQFAPLILASSSDPLAAYIDGFLSCPALTSSWRRYYGSADFNAAEAAAQPFYDSLGAALSGADRTAYTQGLSSANSIYEFLAYQAQHRAPATANASTLGQARAYADALQWNLMGNTSADNGLRPLAGRMLLTQVLETLWLNQQSYGDAAKVTAYVVKVPPMLGLFSVLDLPAHDAAFMRLPDPGSSLVFELFSSGSNATNATAGGNGTGDGGPTGFAYPNDPTDLRVRVLFRNGTDAATPLRGLPVFDRGDEPSILSLTDFTALAVNEATPDAGDWCLACGSAAVFCAGLTNGAVGLSGSSNGDNDDNNNGGGSSSGHAVSAPVAGVIGAVVTLAVLGLLGAAAVFLGGFRVRREQKGKRHSSQLGGFKGAEKLASDPDLPKAGNRTSASTVGASVVGSPTTTQGEHRRVESWEMRGARDARPSFEHNGEAIKELERV